MNNQIKIKILSFDLFSIACEESTDTGGIYQLAVFLCMSYGTQKYFLKLLEIILIYDTTTGEDVFISVCELLKNMIYFFRSYPLLRQSKPFLRQRKIKVSLKNCKKSE